MPLSGSRSNQRATSQFMRSWAKNAELVAFGVGQHDPGSIPLADVHPPRAMSDQPSHLGVLVIRPEVEVQSALGLFGLIEPHEVQPRHTIRLLADLELVSRGVDDNPAERVGPPLAQGHWIHRVDNYLLPIQGHRANLAEPSGTDNSLMNSRSSWAKSLSPPPMCPSDARTCRCR